MMYNGKSRHIRRRHNTVRELLSSGIITIDYVKSKDNVSDPLTKGLSREGVERTSKGMGLRPRTSQHGDVMFFSRCTVSRTDALFHEQMLLKVAILHETTHCFIRNDMPVQKQSHWLAEWT
ncbi:hypothetical protein CQW23_12181 [Capsicum baccatum]|uniref:Uncharacterized protein n=1 Tax=Capsicum baccatum TaxID=33114 RepID=A0A2G2WRV8_CAPBA|nr:hypothetical protein CQW23_12181 [Capsicum baccatum]